MDLFPPDVLIITCHLWKPVRENRSFWDCQVLKYVQNNWSSIPHCINHYWWSHHECSWDQSSVMIRLFDNLQMIANTNLKLPCILSFYIWVYIMFRYYKWYLNSHVVGQIRSVQSLDLTKETTRVIILYDQSEKINTQLLSILY